MELRAAPSRVRQTRETGEFIKNPMTNESTSVFSRALVPRFAFRTVLTTRFLKSSLSSIPSPMRTTRKTVRISPVNFRCQAALAALATMISVPTLKAANGA